MKQHMTSWHFRTGWLPLLVGVLAVGGLLLGTQAASAQDNGPTISPSPCMQTVFGTPVTSSNELNCTANVVSLSMAISVNPSSCLEGTQFDLTVTFATSVTANATYDVGFFVRVDGGANARGDGPDATGTCSLSALTPGMDPALELDGDTCGDLNAGTFEVTFTIPDVTCTGVQDPQDPTRKVLKLPNCTSWHTNANTVCSINDPSGFAPETRSQCVCDDNFTVPVIVEPAELTVVKSAAPSIVPETGQTVTYTVTVMNSASSSVEINTLVDTEYGNLHEASNSAVSNNTCPDLVGVVLGPGESTSCTFEAFVSGDAGETISDTVEVCGSQTNTSATICGEGSEFVTIRDLRPAPPAYNSEVPGSVIVFPKFITGDRDGEPNSSFEISVTCPSGLRTQAPGACPGFDQGTEVKLRGHWVCPADQSFENKSICRETGFDLHTTLFGTVTFNPENSGTGITQVPQPPCERGYLIVWVINEAGAPIHFNALIGDAIIRDANGSVSGYNGIPIQALPIGLTPPGTPIATTDGGLPFTGADSQYALVSNNIQSSVRFDAPLPEAVTTDLTLLTLDVLSNRSNDPTFVELSFYNAKEEILSGSTRFICWTEVSLSNVNGAATFINAGLTATAQGSDKGLVVSGIAFNQITVQPVTLLGIATTSVVHRTQYAYSYSLYHEPAFTPTVFAPSGPSFFGPPPSTGEE